MFIKDLPVNSWINHISDCYCNKDEKVQRECSDVKRVPWWPEAYEGHFERAFHIMGWVAVLAIKRISETGLCKGEWVFRNLTAVLESWERLESACDAVLVMLGSLKISGLSSAERTAMGNINYKEKPMTTREGRLQLGCRGSEFLSANTWWILQLPGEHF